MGTNRLSPEEIIAQHKAMNGPGPERELCEGLIEFLTERGYDTTTSSIYGVCVWLGKPFGSENLSIRPTAKGWVVNPISNWKNEFTVPYECPLEILANRIDQLRDAYKAKNSD